VAKVEWHQGELFARVEFIVTNLNQRSKNVVGFYNGRGTAGQWIKEGTHAVQWTKLSCRKFKDNRTRLQLFALMQSWSSNGRCTLKPSEDGPLSFFVSGTHSWVFPSRFSR
jgi:hypothetical protein